MPCMQVALFFVPYENTQPHVVPLLHDVESIVVPQNGSYSGIMRWFELRQPRECFDAHGGR